MRLRLRINQPAQTTQRKCLAGRPASLHLQFLTETLVWRKPL